jgi:hypothetical protein
MAFFFFELSAIPCIVVLLLKIFFPFAYLVSLMLQAFFEHLINFIHIKNEVGG